MKRGIETVLMYDEIVKIALNKKVNGKYYKLIFLSKRLSKKVSPGQFLNVQISQGLDPFLRRPFSYYRVHGDQVEILYEILGKGTALLAAKKPGDLLRVAGPLGKPFTEKLAKHKKRVLIAGGVGVPPLIFLAENVKADYLLIGAKSKAEVLPPAELKNIRAKVLYATNDGSYGVKGFVTLCLEQVMAKELKKDLYIQTCGPNAMMQAVLDIARKEGVEGEASLDKTMACGVGACLGCMVETTEGLKPSCTEGPVFNFKEIKQI